MVRYTAACECAQPWRVRVGNPHERGNGAAMLNTQVHHQPAGNQNSSLVLTLSIGLQLLAFFVVLNASTKPDETRSQAVLVSVQTAFNPSAVSATRGLAGNKAAAQVALRSSISDAFSPVLDGRDVIVRTDGDLLWVKAPLAVFFDPETNVLRASLPVLDRMIAVLNAPPDNLRYEMLVTIPGANSADTIAAAQAGALAEDLLHRGLTRNVFSLGIVTAPERSVTLTFAALAEDDGSLGALIARVRS